MEFFRIFFYNEYREWLKKYEHDCKDEAWVMMKKRLAQNEDICHLIHFFLLFGVPLIILVAIVHNGVHSK